MKLIIKIFCVFALSVVAVNLFASNSTTATITTDADIKLLISMKEVGSSALNFGVIYVDPSTNGTVTLSPSGLISATGNIQLGGGSSVATFEITGESGSDVSISLLPTSLSNSKGDSLSASYVSSVSLVSLDMSGKATIKIGGSLIIPIGTPVGVYTGSLTLVANY